MTATKQHAGTVAKAFAIVSHLTHAGPASLSEIARALDLSTSSTHRLLSELVQQGTLRQVGDKRYALAPVAWEAGVRALQDIHPNLMELSSGALQLIAWELRRPASLSLPFGVDTLYIARASAPDPIPLYTPIAARRPTYSNAAGKAMLAFDDEDAVNAVSAAGLPRQTEATITTAKALRAQLAEAKQEAVAFNLGEMQPERYAIGVPILDERERPVAGLTLSVPQHDWSPEVVSDAVLVMHAHARRLSMALGYRGTVLGRDGLA